MNGHDLIAEFSELFTPSAKGQPMQSLDRFIHPPSPSGLGDAATARCIYVARSDLLMGGGHVIPRGTVLEPGVIEDPHRLVRTRRVWEIDTEPLGFVLAAQTARPSESGANRAESGDLVANPHEAEPSEQPNKPDTPTRAEAPISATNAQARARQSFPPGTREAPSVVGSTGHRGSRLREARAWLQAALANGPRPAAELFDEADEALHSRRNVERAASQLGVESFQEGRAWWKRLPGSDRQLVQTVQPYARAREETRE